MIPAARIDDLARRWLTWAAVIFTSRRPFTRTIRVNGLLSYLEDYEALRKEDAEAILEDIIPENLRGELPLAPSCKVLPFVHLRQLHDREPEPFDSMIDADELVKVYRLDNVDIGDGSAAGRQAHSLRRGGSRAVVIMGGPVASRSHNA